MLAIFDRPVQRICVDRQATACLSASSLVGHQHRFFQPRYKRTFVGSLRKLSRLPQDSVILTDGLFRITDIPSFVISESKYLFNTVELHYW
jgi:hypothetical protein